jgi:hypothetical protein
MLWRAMSEAIHTIVLLRELPWTQVARARVQTHALLLGSCSRTVRVLLHVIPLSWPQILAE